MSLDQPNEEEIIPADSSHPSITNYKQTPTTPEDAIKDFMERLDELTPGFYMVPTLIVLNVIIFLLMVGDGAGFISNFNNLIFLKWGANFAPYTLAGEWWRLLTCAFLHFGIIHLFMNMWVLLDIGVLVEKLFGHYAFLMIYLGAAFSGSAASILWHGVNAVSAGASGAIFGLGGAILGFLLIQKEHFPEEVFEDMKGSILGFVGYSVLFGLSVKGIDNAAHFGGLGGGFVLGLLFANSLIPKVRSQKKTKKMLLGTVGTLCLVLGGLFGLNQGTKTIQHESLFLKLLDETSEVEQTIGPIAEKAIKRMESNNIKPSEAGDILEKDCLTPWKKLVQKSEKIQLPKTSKYHLLNSTLKEYLETKKGLFEDMIQALKANSIFSNVFGGMKIQAKSKKIEALSKEIQEQMQKLKK